MKRPRILICDDDELVHLTVLQTLTPFYDCKSAHTLSTARELLKNEQFDLVILDAQLPHAREGLDLLREIKEREPDLTVIISSAHTDFETVRAALLGGASDYVGKNVSSFEWKHVVKRNLEKKSWRTSTLQKNFEVRCLEKTTPFIGECAAITRLKNILPRVRESNLNVVIYGETGTGKEVFAKQLRKTSPEGILEPFVTIDASTIQSSMAESLLFGHEKGAFTGAEATVKGIFEEADGGVIYFDEIANMPLEIQAKLLRVLQEKEISRLGSTKKIQLQFRVIAASNKNLETLSKEGKFKSDLLHRLQVIPIEIPALRDRKEDIEPLLQYFARLHAKESKKITFHPSVIECLVQYQWPGNIRELQNVVAYLVTMSDTGIIGIADLPVQIAQNSLRSLPEQSFYDRVGDFEASILKEEYFQNGMNIKKLAEHLKMDRSHLYSKLKQYGIYQPQGH